MRGLQILTFFVYIKSLVLTIFIKFKGYVTRGVQFYKTTPDDTLDPGHHHVDDDHAESRFRSETKRLKRIIIRQQCPSVSFYQSFRCMVLFLPDSDRNISNIPSHSRRFHA